MYLQDNEKSYKYIIENNIKYFNYKKRANNRLQVKFYISDGNKCDVYKNNTPLVCGVDIKTACFVIQGIMQYLK